MELYKKTEKMRLNGERQIAGLMKRITKLKKTKDVFGVELRQACKVCRQDFLESENFNWSCRTHKSEWSGDLWWCCGKTQKDAPGCKFDKHIRIKDVDEEDEYKKKPGGTDEELDKVVCQCCKEVGHKADYCPNDPNFRTNILAEHVN
jgi:hypothetical protein